MNNNEEKLDLNNIRELIDRTDDKINSLFDERLKYVTQVAEYKKRNNVAVSDKERERSIISRVTAGKDNISAMQTKILFTTLFDLSKSRQKTALKGNSDLISKQMEAAISAKQPFPKNAAVAIQGSEGSYSSIAADKLFERSALTYFNSFEGVFRAVDKGMCEFGILPLENSIHGSVSEVIDLFAKYRVYINKAVKLNINHALLGKCNTKFSDITEIISHPQAIGQCSEFLNANKQIKVSFCENTAVAAMEIANGGRNDIASISSVECAELYNLEIIKTGISNSDFNRTRFVCISKSMNFYNRTTKCSMQFKLPNKTGSLYSIISRFAAAGLNLTKLESRPIPGTEFEFMFFLDIDADCEAPEIRAAIDDTASACEQFMFLGAYEEI